MIADNVAIKTTSISEAMDKLTNSLKSYEKSYATTSEKMLASVRSGQTNETSDIVKWLTDYHVLKRWEGRYGHIIGTHTNDT
jgi:hypothetical protein